MSCVPRVGTAADFNGLRKLAEAAGPRFTFGLVLYDGDTVVPFGVQLYAVPVSSLWRRTRCRPERGAIALRSALRLGVVGAAAGRGETG